MYDAFIYRHQDGFVLDCDRRVTGDFMFHLKQYKLRSKIEIMDESATMSICAGWNGEAEDNAVKDERCDWNMWRTIVTSTDGVSRDTDIYNTLRMIKGVPEGPVEIARGKAIPMEYNLELMNGGTLGPHLSYI
ncbi:Aminomethyltransferase folate-binding domain-containing protein [Paramicrosporidium saccamoebae]|uniref:Aminomethyltransferase folate-binding domain-containing protein n=1 Tax=Paramicrosporidium saccamoebae TaxID=1246581 RepID=A0A2H9TN15_9FUNG|nr:Aminomethyltransferase folate-binding domain-containing protein [Paramicrosporidium saccamoebae]